MSRYSYKGTRNLTNNQVRHLYSGLGGYSSEDMFGEIQEMRQASAKRNFINGRFSGHKAKQCPGNLAGVDFWFRRI